MTRIDLNSLLYALSHYCAVRGKNKFSGAELFSRPDSLFASFLKGQEIDTPNSIRRSMLEMLTESGHIEYKLAENNTGYYRIAKPHVKKIYGQEKWFHAGARAKETAKELNAEISEGTCWNIDDFEIVQPDILTFDKKPKGLTSDKKTEGYPEYTPEEPTGDLAGWYSSLEFEPMELNPSDFFEETDKWFNADTGHFSDMDNKTEYLDRGIFSRIGPFHLVKKSMAGKQTRHFIVRCSKPVSGEWTQFEMYILPKGADSLRWAKHLLLSVFGRPSLKSTSTGLIVSRNSMLPISWSRWCISFSGKLPHFSKEEWTYTYILEKNHREIILSRFIYTGSQYTTVEGEEE